MSANDYIELSHLSRPEHDRIFEAGAKPTVEELAGWDFCGWNCSLVPKLGGFQKFLKGFYRPPQSEGDEFAGFNCPVIQNGIDGEWLARPADDAPKRFGFYSVTPWNGQGGAHSLLLDYGAHPANLFVDPTRLIRDLLVKVEGNPDLLLGKAHLALGAWLFVGYFLLRRRREHSFSGAA